MPDKISSVKYVSFVIIQNLVYAAFRSSRE
jgi:hypothetical protein